MNNLIDKYDEIGNSLIDELLLPLFQISKRHVIENSYISQLTKFRQQKIENKVNLFIDSMNLFDNNILEDINNLSQDEKYFLIDSMDKVIEFNDFVQIGIMAYLVSEYKKNEGRLLFWQKSLYYNLNNISENDIKIFIDIIETKERNGKGEIVFYTLTSKNKEQEIIKDKFISLGIFHPDGKRGIDTNFLIPKHAEEFYFIVKKIIDTIT